MVTYLHFDSHFDRIAQACSSQCLYSFGLGGGEKPLQWQGSVSARGRAHEARSRLCPRLVDGHAVHATYRAALFRQVAQDLGKSVVKAHVQQPVRFIQNQNL